MPYRLFLIAGNAFFIALQAHYFAHGHLTWLGFIAVVVCSASAGAVWMTK